MGYRKIPEDKVLEFPATPGFKGWETFFTSDSTTHPAKMNLNLLKWILETYTELGEVVLDPMAGTGSTIILASILGRHGVAVEYESRFCDMIRANIELTERQATLMPKGRMICIQGDARELSKLLGESNAIITSPPYSSQWGVADENRPEATFEREKRHRKRHPELKGKRPPLPGAYSTSMNNIGNLPHGDIDAVVTSPPYSEGTGHGGGPASEKLTIEKKLHLTGSEAYSKPLDAVVTSPPYEASEVGKGVRSHRWEKIKELEGFKGRREWREGTPAHYSENSENIGNLKSETYLEAMLKVYRECFSVLKPMGKMVIVVKNFIREKAVVRLDVDTIKLCEAAGFHLADRWYFKLPTRSFWRILYSKRFPDVPEVKFEDVLIFDKGVDIPGGKVK